MDEKEHLIFFSTLSIPVDDISVADIPNDTSHRDGAIYNNKFLREEYLDGDINDRNESKCFNHLIILYIMRNICVFGKPKRTFNHFVSILG